MINEIINKSKHLNNIVLSITIDFIFGFVIYMKNKLNLGVV